MRKFFLLALMFIGFSGYCQDTYQYVTTGFDKVQYYVKVESTDNKTQEVKLSLKGIIPESKSKDASGDIVSHESLCQVSSMVFHLNNRTYDSLDYAAYTPTGGLLEEGNNFDFALVVYPDSLIEEIYNNVSATFLNKSLTSLN